jgi:hypothetical protein
MNVGSSFIYHWEQMFSTTEWINQLWYVRDVAGNVIWYHHFEKLAVFAKSKVKPSSCIPGDIANRKSVYKNALLVIIQ